jgi:hypothetical protein
MKVPRYQQEVPGASGSGRALLDAPFDQGAKALMMSGEMLARTSRELKAVAMEMRERKQAAEITHARALVQREVNDFMLEIAKNPDLHEQYESLYEEKMSEIEERLPDMFTDSHALNKFQTEFMPLFQENHRFTVAQLAFEKSREYTIALADASINEAIVNLDMDGAVLALESLKGIVPEPEWVARKNKAETSIVKNAEYKRMELAIASDGELAKWEPAPETQATLSQNELDDLKGHFRTQRNLYKAERAEMYNKTTDMLARDLIKGKMWSKNSLLALVDEGQLDMSSAVSWWKIMENEAEKLSDGGSSYAKELSKITGGVEGENRMYNEFHTRIINAAGEPDAKLPAVRQKIYEDMVRAVAENKMTNTSFRILNPMIREEFGGLREGLIREIKVARTTADTVFEALSGTGAGKVDLVTISSIKARLDRDIAGTSDPKKVYSLALSAINEAYAQRGKAFSLFQPEVDEAEDAIAFLSYEIKSFEEKEKELLNSEMAK